MFAKEEVNTGRQIEFDYLKGLFIPMILLIHSFQMMGGAVAQVAAYKVTYMIATLTGSAIFLFVMGLGSTYSKRSVRQLMFDGIRLIGYQLLWNLLVLCLPAILGQGIRMMAGRETDWAYVAAVLPMFAEYINIFFIAGICYLLLAFLKWIKTPLWVYFALALLFIFLNPYLYMTDKSTGNAVLDYLFTMFAGGRSSVSMCCLTHIPYTLLGVGFGKVLRKTADKKKLYGIISIGAAAVLLIYFMDAFRRTDNLEELYTYSRYGYIYPGTLRSITNCSSVLLMAAVLYALRNQIEKIRPLQNVLIHLSKRTTTYYAIHPFWYGLTTSLVLFAPLSAWTCLWMTPVVWLLCYSSIRIWDRIRKGNT